MEKSKDTKMTVKSQYEKTRSWMEDNVPPIVPQVITATATVGTFLAVVTIAREARWSNKFTKALVRDQMRAVASQKEMISNAVANDYQFQHFPGLGVLVNYPVGTLES